MREWRLQHRERINVYMREHRRSGSEPWRSDPDHPAHGKSATYANGCRCDQCTTAQRDYMRAYRAARKEDVL